jgi:hypothetical protein
VTGIELNITAMMGMTMIVGIVTEVAIFFFSEFFDVAAERPVSVALVEAGQNRIDSLLEGDGFELSVPLAKERRFRPLITRNSLTTTPSAFQIGGNSIRSQGIT